jgi:hypothetical protein
VNETVKNGIGNCAVFKKSMPFLNGELAGYDGGTVTEPILNHFE